MSITVYDDSISLSIASHIKNPESNRIKFCGIAFECETIEDCKGNLFVKAVRCKDCKYYKSVLAHCTIRGDKAFLIRGANDYCSRAERREE